MSGSDRRDEGKLLEAAVRVLETCSEMPAGDRLQVLHLAWMLTAQQVRQEALAFPGGFPSEQSRQIEQLKKIIALVEADTPDLELERLIQEGDVEGAITHIREQHVRYWRQGGD